VAPIVPETFAFDLAAGSPNVQLTTPLSRYLATTRSGLPESRASQVALPSEIGLALLSVTIMVTTRRWPSLATLRLCTVRIDPPMEPGGGGADGRGGGDGSPGRLSACVLVAIAP